MGRVAPALALAALLMAACGVDGGDTDGDPLPGDGGPAAIDSPARSADPARPTGPDTGAAGATPPSGQAVGADWTAGVVEGGDLAAGQAVLNDVRIGRHEGYDRITFELDLIPGYHIEYVDRPVHQCGSGNVVEVAGDGWLLVRLHSARAHTEAGQPTIEWRERSLDFPVIREVERICDFEGEVSYVIGVGSPNRFRVLTLSGPARLVVDIRH